MAELYGCVHVGVLALRSQKLSQTSSTLANIFDLAATDNVTLDSRKTHELI